jgi:O-acetyl-ADP-ribose deacetylase (regulator of RNase III)
MVPRIVKGDLLKQDVDVIVNAWNRNVIPWWLLIPQGVSRAIKKKAGYEPFRELAKHGWMPLGSAVLTGSGRLGFEGIIHVAGINLLWIATARSIQKSVRSAMSLVREHGFSSVAFPIVGSGSGGRNQEKALEVMLDAFEAIESQAKVIIVEYERNTSDSAR